jgi:hypothetical protein
MSVQVSIQLLRQVLVQVSIQLLAQVQMLAQLETPPGEPLML